MALKINKQSDMLVLIEEISEPISKAEIKAAEMAVSTQIEDDSDLKWVVYDLSRCEKMKASTIPFLCNFTSRINEAKVKLALIPSPKIYELIQSQGLGNAFSMFKNIDDFRKQTSTKKTGAATEFLNTLLDSVIYTMKVSLETEVKALSPLVIKANSDIPSLQVGAIAGIISQHFNGNILIGFSKPDFLKAMSLFLAMDVENITDETKDGAAELLNVFIGQAKIKLNEKSFDIQQVIPSVVTGEQVDVGPMSHQTAIMIPFECGFGNFFVILTTNAPKSK